MKKTIFILTAIFFFSSFITFGAERGNVKTIKFNLNPQKGYSVYSEVRDINNKVIAYISPDVIPETNTADLWVTIQNDEHSVYQTVRGEWFIVEIEGAVSFYMSNEPYGLYQGNFFWQTSLSPVWSRENLDSYGIFTFEALFDLTTTDQLEIRF